MKQSLFVLFFCLVLSCKQSGQNKSAQAMLQKGAAAPAKVEVSQKGKKYRLLVNGEEFFIKGAGLEFGNVSALAEHKANSFRTWRTENGQKSAKEVLDEAHKNGIMVTMGIEVGRERHGFDYNKEEMVLKQLNDIKKEIMTLKDHPALLIWGIGNELNLHYKNPKVWDAVNDISKMIHAIDPNHPTTTSLAGLSQKEVDFIKERCPDLDILSVQMYGDLPNLPNLIKKFGWEGPYMVTEWGATGHWEVPTTAWGAPIEENSSVKANNYLKRYQGGIAADSLQCIGSYVFLWGNKQERTPTWYGIFLEDGKETESVDVMHYIWNGEWPSNRTPIIKDYTLDGKTAHDNVLLKKDRQYVAQIVVKDFEKDTIVYDWEIMPESTDLKEGGDLEEKPEPINGLIVSQKLNKVTFKSPTKGAYRLFVYASDGNNQAATANIPFMVE
ncbi:glycoside hydrolase family 2 TIM barrel-domain containing protein [Kriegella aquimaris]|uniref:Glycosyl hydrolases family 2, TIM barrel domain n=1 Tax=Kriegella aquimaris TaxID=192904 RepID=A0A1G9WZH2_9FLAO|nr:glycoside hydrolase family 2 TIM barrel-domain containing protein [Kriegella aquimaris]SDM89543.1 Glycosyl hydrolases family 2, TIM barrel domain [Kriegella aquimaris]